MDRRCRYEEIGAHEAKHREEKDEVSRKFFDEVRDKEGSAEASGDEGKHLGGDRKGVGVASDVVTALKKTQSAHMDKQEELTKR